MANVYKQLKKAGLICPKCGSENVVLLNNTKKSLSAGKMLIGGALAGPVGAAAGAALGTRGKREYICRDCGRHYTVKN